MKSSNYRSEIEIKQFCFLWKRRSTKKLSGDSYAGMKTIMGVEIFVKVKKSFVFAKNGNLTPAN
jgi:hypothetical protein